MCWVGMRLGGDAAGCGCGWVGMRLGGDAAGWGCGCFETPGASSKLPPQARERLCVTLRITAATKLGSSACGCIHGMNKERTRHTACALEHRVVLRGYPTKANTWGRRGSEKGGENAAS